mmetsp:Transcript_33355/g.51133  ORF Transcript_33355/g.51133 Transcript_33355/m.51133 type:complete len:94 (-) Transcript_33355:3-284(-)
MVDGTDKDRLSIVQELLLEMASHPQLRERDITFQILINKTDSPEAEEAAQLRKYFMVDELKKKNRMRYQVQDIVALTGENVAKSIDFFQKSLK